MAEIGRAEGRERGGQDGGRTVGGGGEEEKEKFPEKRKVSAISDERHKTCLISAKAHCTQAECICSV